MGKDLFKCSSSSSSSKCSSSSSSSSKCWSSSSSDSCQSSYSLEDHGCKDIKVKVKKVNHKPCIKKIRIYLKEQKPKFVKCEVDVDVHEKKCHKGKKHHNEKKYNDKKYYKKH